MGSIKMSKLGCKIMSGLTACIIGLSPCIGTQVFAAPVFIRSIKQSKEIEDCTKEELLEVVPDLWERFWTDYAAARADVYDAADAADDAIHAAGHVAWDIAWDAADVAGDAAYDAASDAAGADAIDIAWYVVYYAAFNAAFANAWGPGGVAYKIVKYKNRAYFENLVRVLEKQIAILQNIVNQNQH